MLSGIKQSQGSQLVKGAVPVLLLNQRSRIALAPDSLARVGRLTMATMMKDKHLGCMGGCPLCCLSSYRRNPRVRLL